MTLEDSLNRPRKGCVVASASDSTGLAQCAGFGAAKHLAETGHNVTLIDAAPNPGGLSAGWRTPQGRAVEAGIKGFWYQVLQPASCKLPGHDSDLMNA